MLTVNRDKIDALTIAIAGAHACAWRSAAANGSWRAPLDARADFTVVDGLVSRMNTLQMKSIASAEPADLRSTASTNPRPPC